jgi:hypothetical protein
LFQYEAWKFRELTRLKRDAEEREQAALEKAELARRRSLTDEERTREDQASSSSKEVEGGQGEGEKPKWKFMQKYFHKGVFYLDQGSVREAGDVRLKDYAREPTLEDKVDKERLPLVLQVCPSRSRSLLLTLQCSLYTLHPLSIDCFIDLFCFCFVFVCVFVCRSNWRGVVCTVGEELWQAGKD